MATKILFDNIIFSLQRTGGISVYWSELIGRMKRELGDFSFLEHRDATTNLFRKQLMISDDKITSLPASLPVKLARYLPVPVERKEYGIFHSSYYRVPSYGNNLRKVVTVHDFTYERYSKGVKRKLHALQKTNAIASADVVICVSESTRNDLLSIYPRFKNKDLRVIHNGVSKDFSPLPETNQNAWNTPYILFVGSRAPYKNFDFTVDLLTGLSEYQLVIVGQPLSAGERLNLESKMRHRYTVCSSVSAGELNRLYNEAFCLVYPSFYEGFGIPVIEAMSAGCPVVALNSSSLPEVCGPAGLLVDELKTELFREAISRISSNRTQLLKKGFEHAARFSWDRCFDETLNIYKELGFDT